MTTAQGLDGRTVLVIGRGSGIAYASALAIRDAGAGVIVAGRSFEQLRAADQGELDIGCEIVDVTDDASIAALGDRLGNIDHVVSTASARARGRLADLTREAVLNSVNTKVIGPLMLAKHLGRCINEGGSLVLFSGVAAFKIAVGTLAVAITNGAADTLTWSLAVEPAPIRVNAISPGVIDTGAWDALGEQGKVAMFGEQARQNPARRIGAADDIASAVVFALTNTFLTGVTLAVDVGEALS